MSLSPESEIAAIINKTAKTQDDILENAFPDEGLNVFILSPFETINLTSSYTITALMLGTSAFVIDHPVYGDIDSNTLHLDGDYASTSVLYSSITV